MKLKESDSGIKKSPLCGTIPADPADMLEKVRLPSAVAPCLKSINRFTNMIQEALQYTQDRDTFIQKFKQKCDYFPHIEKDYFDNQLHYGSWVRFKRGNTWYNVFCVRSVGERKPDDAEKCLMMFVKDCYDVIHLYIINPEYSQFHITDILQITEKERLARQQKPF